ncbi:DUF1805 domain-containing protein [bacterium]|nr:DUF1805 domain-containing protein [bacterium]
MNWDGFQRTRHDLKRPLLVISGSKGVLACGYLNVATFDKLGDAGAIVRGVNNFEDMLTAKVVECSESASELGVELGMSGGMRLSCFGEGGSMRR